MGLSLEAVTGALILRDQWTDVLNKASSETKAFGATTTATLGNIEKSAESLGKSATSAGKSMSVGLTAPITLALGYIGKLGIDAVESRNLIEKSFDDMTGDADRWAANLSKTLGLNRYETEKTAGVLFNMTTGMGLSKEAAFAMSTGVVQLAADMASFRNIGMDEALQKIKSGLTGEAEPLKAIGILVDENTVKTYAYKNGIAAQGLELTQQQKVLARYGAILQQTANDQGDLAKTADSPANKLRIMRSAIEEAATSIGVSLVPMITSAVTWVSKVVPVVQSAVEWFGRLPGPAKEIAVGIALTVAAAGPALIVFGALAGAVSSVAGLMVTLGVGATAAGVGTVAAGAGATVATPAIVGAGTAAASTTVALGLMGSAVLAVGVFMAGWQVGKWIDDTYRLSDSVSHIAGYWMGLTGAEVEATNAAVRAADAHVKATPPVADLAAEVKKATDALAEEALRLQAAAEKTAAAEFATKAHASAVKTMSDALVTANATANVTHEVFAATDAALRESAAGIGVFVPALQTLIEANGTLTTSERAYLDLATQKRVGLEAYQAGMLNLKGVTLAMIETDKLNGLSQIEIANKYRATTAAVDRLAAAKTAEAAAMAVAAQSAIANITAELNAQLQLNQAWGRDAVGNIQTQGTALDDLNGKLGAIANASGAASMKTAQNTLAMKGYTDTLYETAIAEDKARDAVVGVTAAASAIPPVAAAAGAGLAQMGGSAQQAAGGLGSLRTEMDAAVRASDAAAAAFARNLVPIYGAGGYLGMGTPLGRTYTGVPTARAEGGPVAASTPYLVGEKGPELFVPSASGVIVPRGGGGSGSGVVIHNTFHVVDTEANIVRRVGDQITRTLMQGQKFRSA